MLKHAMDRETFRAVQVFEAERIKELYAQMLTSAHKIPDFKSRLLALQENQGKIVPGFQRVRKDSPCTRYQDNFKPAASIRSSLLLELPTAKVQPMVVQCAPEAQPNDQTKQENI